MTGNMLSRRGPRRASWPLCAVAVAAAMGACGPASAGGTEDGGWHDTPEAAAAAPPDPSSVVVDLSVLAELGAGERPARSGTAAAKAKRTAIVLTPPHADRADRAAEPAKRAADPVALLKAEPPPPVPKRRPQVIAALSVEPPGAPVAAAPAAAPTAARDEAATAKAPDRIAAKPAHPSVGPAPALPDEPAPDLAAATPEPAPMGAPPIAASAPAAPAATAPPMTPGAPFDIYLPQMAGPVTASLQPDPPRDAALVPDIATGGPAARPGIFHVPFERGLTTLSDDARRTVENVAQRLLRDDQLRLSLLAYAGGDPTSPHLARRLALYRALAVRAKLVEKGIWSTRIDVRALGDRYETGPPDRVDLILFSP